MSDVPTPAGYDVYWEKWIDAFEAESNEEAAADIDEAEYDLPSYEDATMEEEMMGASLSHIRSIITPSS